MDSKDLISVAAFALSLIATIISISTKHYEKQRAIKREITDLLAKLSALQIDNAKLFKESANDPIYYQAVSSILNQQNVFILQQVAYLMVQVPHLVTAIEYNSLALATANAGDIITANEYYAKAVEIAPPPYYKALALRSYAGFLFLQREFERGRDRFKDAVSRLSGSDNFTRYTRGFTYQMWGWNELNNAHAPQRAAPLFESAENEFKGIDNKVFRESALNVLAIARISTDGATGTTVTPYA